MTESEQISNFTLITFPPSLDSELARFLLAHYGISYLERPHSLIFSSFVTLRHGRSIIFPLLYGNSLRLVGPRAIGDYFNSRFAPTLSLWPEAEAQKRQVEVDWATFNHTLAFATARIAYYHLLPIRNLMVRPLSQGTPDVERRIVQFAYPVFAGLLQMLLWLTEKKVKESLEQVRAIFATVGERLAGNRQFLIGDQLSLSDIAFADAAAPVVLPAAYGGPIPPLSDMPIALQEIVREMRCGPAGEFALRIYEKYRHGLGARIK
jgi:glutathione S-transferase